MSAIRPQVTFETSLGAFSVVLYADLAPVTVSNFLAYVDSGRYENTAIFRIVNPVNQEPADPVRISVIHGGTQPLAKTNLPMIPLESTQLTGLTHRHGTLSMGREERDSAEGDFFVCIGDQPHFDHGGARHPDGLGFAAFGEVSDGMDVVEAIFAAAGPQEYLAPDAVIPIYGASRTL